MTKSIFDILADGLDASTDGRGWSAEHERARILANSAPTMLTAIKALLAQNCGDPEDLLEGDDPARALYAALRQAVANAEAR